MTTPTILVVEDHANTAKMFRVALSLHGYTVIEARDGQSAIRAMKSQPVGLVLQDLILPDMSGIELLDQLRALRGAAEIPIIAVSGFLTGVQHIRDLQAGFTEFLFKPVEVAILLSMVAAYLPSTLASPQLVGARLVLAVDDDPVQLKLLRLRLEQAGHQVVTAIDGDDALEQARRSPPDAIVSDILMPGMDGFQLVGKIRQDPQLAQIPVVLISSAYNELENQRLAHATGAHAIVPRRPDLKQMSEALEGALARSVESAPDPLPETLSEEYTHRVILQLERQVNINFQLSKQMSVETARLSVLAGLGEFVSRKLASDELTTLEIMQELLFRCLDAAGISKGAIYLLSGSGRFVLRAQLGYSGARASALSEFFGRTDLLERTLAQDQPMEVPSALAPADEFRELLGQAEATSMLLVPLSHRRERLGVVVIASDREERDEEWSLFGAALGNQLSQAISLARTLDQLKENEQRLRRVLETAPAGILTLNRKGRIQSANSAAEQIFGLSRQELFGRYHDDPRWQSTLVDGSAAPAGSGGFDRAVRDGLVSFGRERSLVRSDGERVILSFNVAPLTDGSGAIIGVLTAVIDVTERKRAEQEREQLLASELASHKEVEALLSLAEQLNAAMNLDTIIHGIVQAANNLIEAHYVGVSTNEGGHALQRLAWMNGAFSSASARIPLDASVTGWVMQNARPFEAADIGNDPRASWFKLAEIEPGPTLAVPLLGPEGNVLATLVIVRRRGEDRFSADHVRLAAAIAHHGAVALERGALTERLHQVTEERLRDERLRAAGQLAAGLAHDLNNVLGIALGRTEMMLEPADSRQRLSIDQIDSLTLIHTAVLDAAQAVRRLQTFARAGDTAEFGPVRLEEVAHEAIQLAQPRWRDEAQAQGRSIRVEEVVSVVPIIYGIAAELREASLNLIINAIDAMPEGGTATIKVYEDGPNVVISVADTGTGMTPEVTAHVWEPFYTTKQDRGTGLGLPMVHGIVERHHGSTSLWSELGTGTEVTLRFPAAGGVAVPASAAVATTDTRRLHVLVVDDEAAVRETTTAMLQLLGHEVEQAGSAAEALSRLDQNGYDFLITDHGMPGMTGIELAKSVHGLYPSLPIVLLTGWGQTLAASRVEQAFGGRIASKPLTLDSLRSLLQWASEADAEHLP